MTLLLTSVPVQNIWKNHEDSLLNCLAEVGLVDTVVAMLNGRSHGNKADEDQDNWNVKDGDRLDGDQTISINKVGDTFLHAFALSHNLGKFCRKLVTNRLLNTILKTQMLKKNSDGDTFLAVAVKNTRSPQKTEDQTDVRMKEAMQDTIDAMELITERFGEETLVSLLMPKYGDSLLHIAVQESFKDLVAYFLSLLPEPENILNHDGYNPLHLAVYNNNLEMVKLILESDKQNEEMPTIEKLTKTIRFNVNNAMANGETALPLAAQFGYCGVLGELIDYRGDLSVRDKEDGHTPLHDCLQQVFFEGGADDAEKCHKFFTVWDKVVEKAVKWWCTKQSSSPFSEDPSKRLSIQAKAVYYLRSCIENNNGLSVLQFAADRGLVSCVQKMLAEAQKSRL